MLLQFLCGLSQRGVVIRVLIATHPLPVDGFRHDGGIGMFADNLIITAVRFCELLVYEVNPSQPHRQLPGIQAAGDSLRYGTSQLRRHPGSAPLVSTEHQNDGTMRDVL